MTARQKTFATLLVMALGFTGCFADLSGIHFKCSKDEPRCPAGQACDFNTGFCEPLDAFQDAQGLDAKDTKPAPDTQTDDGTAPDETQDADACVPQCQDKECGPNGCGGLCGTCGSQLESCINGKCVVPAVCGDGKCEKDKGENCGTCTQDCMCGVGEVCFNAACCTPKNCATESWECGLHSNDCGGQVRCGTCAEHQACDNGRCVDQPFCGDGTCQDTETCNSCLSDCGECCGNGTCDQDFGENCANCAADCACGQGQTCFQGSCCTPRTCQDAGAVCGPVDDWCGSGID